MVARVPGGAHPRQGRANRLPVDRDLVAPQILQKRIGPTAKVRWPLPMPLEGAEAAVVAWEVANMRMARFLS